MILRFVLIVLFDIMEYRIETKFLKELINLYLEGKLNLTPPYQRNAVWTTNAQSDLIDSIRKNFPLPTFFIMELANGTFDMVDGQQRTRAILMYYKTNALNESVIEDSKFKENLFKNYKIHLTVITKLEESEKIEDFYFRVNSTGLHLNRPEKIKSKYLSTNLLQLSETILDNPLLYELELFTPSSKRRMLDRDFVEELIALMYWGITDKKISVDKLYKKDLTTQEVKRTEKRLVSILQIINEFDEYYPLNATRYKQRNDLYTLFSFLKKHNTLSKKTYLHYYKILVAIGKEIKPSDDTCPVFKDYAIHCVSQSNSKDAREKRLKIIEDILIGLPDGPTQIQRDILKYYNMSEDDMKKKDLFSFNIPRLKKSIEFKYSQAEI